MNVCVCDITKETLRPSKTIKNQSKHPFLHHILSHSTPIFRDTEMIYMAMFTQNASATGRWRRVVIPTKGGLDIWYTYDV